MDRILIDNLRVDCLVGVSEEERRTRQKVIIDVALTLDLGRAARSMKIDDTIDYREAKRQIAEFVSSGEFVLLESLAEGIASLALERFQIEAVKVRVGKEKYSLEPTIGVEIERFRGDPSR